MSFKINFTGANKADTLKSVQESSKQLLESKDMDAGAQKRMEAFINALPDNAAITGSVQDRGNGSTVYDVTVRDVATPEVKAGSKTAVGKSTATPTGGKPMEGAAGNGRPEAAPGGSVANRSSTSPSPAAASAQATAAANKAPGTAG